jgi:hypothetical protein
MYPDLPIEQLLRRKDTRFQLGFASEAKDLVPDRDDFLLSASQKGLHVLAKNEDSLTMPVEVLRAEGVQVQEPVMHVRICLHRRHLDPVKQALENRSATLTEQYARSSYCVLRFEAPLADLLGLSAELGKLAEGTAKHWVALSHYRLVTRHPGGTAA